MSQTLIPLGALLFLVLLVYAFVREARKQRSAARRLHEELARANGWRFDLVDDGTVQRASAGMEAIGCFESPSLGKMAPRNVVSGTLPEGRVWLYEHWQRISEDEAYHWNVCLIEGDSTPCAPAVIRFSDGSRTLSARNRFYTGEELPLPEPLRQQFLVYTRHPERLQSELPMDLLQKLHEAWRALPFRVDVQIRGKLVAVYPAERNATIDSLDGLEQLLGFSRQAVRVLRTPNAAAAG
jgi:hypothetical protein